MSNVFDNSWEPKVFVSVFDCDCLCHNKFLSWDMLNNFGFQVQAQKSNVKFMLIPWHMLNNFCFHANVQKARFIGENGNNNNKRVLLNFVIQIL